MKITQFQNPELLWLLAVVLPMMIVFYIFHNRKGRATITVSSTLPLKGIKKGLRYYLQHLPFVLRCMAAVLVVFALARPQSSQIESNTKTRGIDIMLTLDVSTSMLARDFKPDRITAAKEVAASFVSDRQNDRIGIVVFAGESFTQSPLTGDKPTLLTLLGQVRTGMINDGTAIGNGLATAINRLKESDAKSKVVILLTDGMNNAGQIAPLMAAEIAADYGIRVYTIGVGTRGTAPAPAMDRWGRMVFAPTKVEIDEDMLKDMAEMTGGQYFRATDNATLEAVYDEINQLEKSIIESSDHTHYMELYGRFLIWALVLLVMDVLLKTLWLRRLP